jgi:predicted RNA binding protein YcfA (HicA-like mRNA interferase family)
VTGVEPADLQRLVEAFGFAQLRAKGSHHIFGRTGIAELVNLQEVGGQAKPYQVRQFLRLVDRYDLRLEEP